MKKYDDEVIMSNIRRNIETIMKESGKTLYWYAKHSDLEYDPIWRILTKRRAFINIKTLAQLSNCFDIAPEELISKRKDK